MSEQFQIQISYFLKPSWPSLSGIVIWSRWPSNHVQDLTIVIGCRGFESCSSLKTTHCEARPMGVKSIEAQFGEMSNNGSILVSRSWLRITRSVTPSIHVAPNCRDVLRLFKALGPCTKVGPTYVS
ncbi:hypothetical protein TNCV_469981 [Trichonephila clavipes]|nr:hypothetical protein TNCV_469981 [Trichonephila clavipes]